MGLVNGVTNESLYVLAPSLQQGFLDKDTGLPLAYGIVTFYRDKDRTPSGLKDVYKITGTPDDPVFVPLQNPMTLSSIGTMFDDNDGQDIIPYYKPFDDEGNIDLYYITVTSAPKPGFPDGVPQFTREHYPSVNGQGDEFVSQVNNFIPNGQFLEHIDLPNDGLIPNQLLTPLAYGGWDFVIDNPHTSTNFVTFDRFNAPTDDPPANPRYAVRISCTSPNPAESRKDLSLFITDCNFLQGQPATVQFVGYTNDGGEHNIQLILRKSYGDGVTSSLPTEEVLATITVTPEIKSYLTNFVVSSNEGKIISPNDIDKFELIVRAPTSSISDISYTNFMGVAGTFSILNFPDVTPEQIKAFAFPASFISPASDGTDEGKFVSLDIIRSHQQEIVNTDRLGFVYRNPVPTGAVLSYGGVNAPLLYLLCDGQSYAIDGYDGSGTVVAYNDLWNVIGTNFGTGINGFTNVPDSMNGRLKIVWNRFDILQPAPIAGTSGFTFTLLAPAVPNTAPQIYACDVLAGSAIVPSSYYILPVNTGTSQFIQLMFFAVDGVGTIPNVTHDVARRIDVSASWSVNQVRDRVAFESNGLFQVPDLRGNSIRYWNSNAPTVGNGSDVYHHDSDADIREPSGSMTSSIITVPSGSSGNSIGSYQRWQVGAPSAFGGEGYYYVSNQAGGSINSTGGQLQLEVVTNDTRGNNLYLNAIIKT